MTAVTLHGREAIGESPNPMGLTGIEFIEYATSRPQALGQVLEMMGFRPVARHRSRGVLLYRQGGMNVVTNARASARWLGEEVLRRSVPLPNRMRLKAATPS